MTFLHTLPEVHILLFAFCLFGFWLEFFFLNISIVLLSDPVPTGNQNRKNTNTHVKNRLELPYAKNHLKIFKYETKICQQRSHSINISI